MLTLKPIYQFVLAGLAMMLFLESTPAATMSINPKNGISGTLVTVHGSEFPPNERIDIVWLMPVDPVLSAELVDAADHVPIDDNGSFTTTIVVPKSAPINEEVNISVFISEGSIITGTSFTVIDKEPAECADAYFIGVHGTAEGPDGQNQILSQVIGETWENFYNLVTKSGKTVKGYAIDYPAPLWRAPISAVNAIEGSKALEERVFKESCLTPRIVFTGYSLGAWVINEWIAQISAPAPIFSLLNTIQAVELYGDPLWYRFGPSFPADQPQPYKGLARHAHDISPFIPIPPSYDNDPQGPGGDLSNRWQSRCLKGDPVCGEDYIGLDASGRQLNDILHCNENEADPCEHQKYHVGTDGETKNFHYYPATKLTTNGAKFLALKTFPEVFTTDEPEIAHIETLVEGVYVYFRLYYIDPHNEVNGFGFVGADGSGWGEENHPFSALPYWARYRQGFNRVDYPFKHLCGEPGEYESVVEAWLDHCTESGCTRVSRGRKIRMKCDAPEEVVTPFFDH